MTKTPSPLIQPLLELRRRRPLAIAHRGPPPTPPKHTLGAFRKAHSLGTDLWEVDAALTGDGTCVECHDEELHCIDGKDPQPGRLDGNRIRNSSKLNGETLPAFAHVVSLARHCGVGIYVSISHYEAGIAAWREMRRQDLRR